MVLYKAWRAIYFTIVTLQKGFLMNVQRDTELFCDLKGICVNVVPMPVRNNDRVDPRGLQFDRLQHLTKVLSRGPSAAINKNRALPGPYGSTITRTAAFENTDL